LSTSSREKLPQEECSTRTSFTTSSTRVR
jgi:hypothetical protein